MYEEDVSKSRIDKLMSRAKEFESESKYSQAISVYDWIIYHDTENLSAYLKRSECKRWVGDAAGQDKDMSFLLKKWPEEKAYHMRALLRGIMYDNKGAIRDWDRVLMSKPDNEVAWFFRGKYNTCEGNYVDALSDFDKTISIEQKKGKGSSESSISYYPDALFLRGIVKKNLKDFQGALSDLDICILLTPDSSKLYRVRSRTMSLMGNDQNAFKDYKTYLKLSFKERYNFKSLRPKVLE